MAEFKYKAVTYDGSAENGISEAADREELMHRLREQKLYPLSVKEYKAAAKATPKPLRLKQLSAFCRQLAAMLHAGVSMAKALDTLCQSGSDKRTRAVSLAVYEGVLKGQSLSESMKQQEKVFPELLIYMTETGEASGTLDVIMEKMAKHFEREQQMKKKIMGALTYPILLSVVAVFVVTFLLTAVLPQFLEMYEGVALPMPTRVLMGISTFLTEKWGVALGVLLGVVLLCTWLMSQKAVRIAIDDIKLRLPIAGKLQKTILTSRFASTFSVLYGSGISILRSIDVTSRVMGNQYVEQKMMMVSESLRQGGMLSAALSAVGIFNPMFLSMVLVGEESGSLDEMLEKTGAFFEKESAAALSQMVALIEPVMIVVFGVIIGFIVLAIILPIFGMYAQML